MGSLAAIDAATFLPCHYLHFRFPCEMVLSTNNDGVTRRTATTTTATAPSLSLK